MLSSFLKKLLFARQFFMVDGRIEVLGKKQIMLPSDVLTTFESASNGKLYINVRSVIRKDIEDYAKKLGSSEEGILKNIDDIFGTFGLGKLELVYINFKKRTCILRLHNPPLRQTSDKNDKTPEFQITPAVLSGVFSFLFKRDIDVKQTKQAAGDFGYCEYVVV